MHSLQTNRPSEVVGITIEGITARGTGTPTGVLEDVIVDGIQYPDQVTDISAGQSGDASIAYASVYGLSDAALTLAKKKQGLTTGEPLKITAVLYKMKDSVFTKHKSVELEGCAPSDCGGNSASFMVKTSMTAATFNDTFENCDNLALDIANSTIT